MANFEINLPDIGEGVTEGELVKWLVKEGESVLADQPLAEVMTDKASVEIPSPKSGVVKSLRAKVGDVLAIGATLCVLDSKELESKTNLSTNKTHKSFSESSSLSFKDQSANRTITNVVPEQSYQVIPPPADLKVLATPSTRRLARELKVDINQLSGTGLAGRVTREDILKKVSVQGAGATIAGSPSYTIPSKKTLIEETLEERIPLVGIRRKIAENMQLSKRVIPHFTLMDEANVTELVSLREGIRNKFEDIKITYLPFVIKALIATLKKFPMVNASIDDNSHEIVYKKNFNVGFAADTPNGLLVPVLKFADKKTIIELSHEIIDLAQRAREGKLKSEEMKGATITITNIGSISGTYATPIINHPEVAILGMYKIFDKPAFSNEKWINHKTMNFTLTADHRLIDGAVAARFLKSFIEKIENPGVLMLDLM